MKTSPNMAAINLRYITKITFLKSTKNNGFLYSIRNGMCRYTRQQFNGEGKLHTFYLKKEKLKILKKIYRCHLTHFGKSDFSCTDAYLTVL